MNNIKQIKTGKVKVNVSILRDRSNTSLSPDKTARAYFSFIDKSTMFPYKYLADTSEGGAFSFEDNEFVAFTGQVKAIAKRCHIPYKKIKFVLERKGANFYFYIARAEWYIPHSKLQYMLKSIRSVR